MLMMPYTPPTDHSKDLIKRTEEMMNSMLKGGHSYEYSRECVEAHYDEAIAKAEEEYEEALAEWREDSRRQTRDGMITMALSLVVCLGIVGAGVYYAVAL